MKKSAVILYSLLIAFITWGCSDSSTGSGSDIVEASSEKQFVWDAMNFWYFWQQDVPELADNQSFFSDRQEFQNFLINFSDSRELYNALLFEQDDFSFFIDNFGTFEQSQQGISTDFGFDFGLVQISGSNNIFGYVQFVIPDSPADMAGLKRGDIFTGINGTTLTVDNFRSALSGNSYDLTMAEIIDGSITDNGETVSVQAVTLQRDPVFLSTILETGSKRIGYIVYNSFRLNSHEELNNIFGDFNSQNIDELIVDLRYNGGGPVVTSVVLASLISGLGSNDLFGEFSFNTKRSDQNQPVSFVDDIPIFNANRQQTASISANTLNINRVFILTGFGTASASETLINGLKSFIDVILVGRTTVGKDEGSITLYDAPAPFTDREAANPDHRKAIQPIVLKIVNADGDDFPLGFEPDIAINEVDFLDDLPPLGDFNEPVLAGALEMITNEAMAKQPEIPFRFSAKPIISSQDLRQAGKNMYILPGDLKSVDF